MRFTTVHPPEDFATIQREASDALHCLDNLTSEGFALGYDRPARASLVRILNTLGAADALLLAEYPEAKQ
jgi:hypothetical protein